MNQLTKLILNTASLIIVLGFNYLSNTKLIGEASVGAISARYDTLITPAGYAFAIWGLIYLMLILFTGFQWYDYSKSKNSVIVEKTGIWFTMANIANSLWVVAWVSDMIGLSVLIMVILLGSLIQLVKRLDLEMWEAPFSIIFFVWWPITIYFGWITLATVLNVATFLVSLGWDGGFLSPLTWGIIMISISAILYLLLTYSRNLREAGVVGIWGLLAITYRQWGLNQEIAIASIIAAAIIFLYVSYHAYKNKKSWI
jgi:hypothetical protein